MNATTAKGSSSASDPVFRIFVADDFRIEASGKVTAVGLYADSVVVLQVPPDAPDPTPESPYALDSLSVLVNVTGLDDEHEVGLSFGKYADKSPPTVLPSQRYSFSTGRSVNLIASFRPLVFQSFGKKTVEVNVDNRWKKKLQFELRKTVLDSAAQAPVQAKPPVAAKPRSTPVKSRTKARV